MLVAASTLRRCTIALALLSVATAVPAEGTEPFGLATVAVAQGTLPAAWRQLQSEMQAEARIIAQCRAAPKACPLPAALRFIAIADEGNHHEGLARIGHINRAVNLAIAVPGGGTVQPAWRSPLHALAGGSGDCKQYAVVKYAALVDSGVAADDLRLVIVRIRQTRNPQAEPSDHALVAVRLAADWIILDNRSLAMIPSRQLLDRYMPLFALDHRGVRQFVQLSRPNAGAAPCAESAG